MTRFRLAAGAAAWLAACAYFQPHPLDTPWGYVLLLFAPLVLVPIGLLVTVPLAWPGRAAAVLQLPCALLLIVAFARPAGVEAALWSLPWLIVTGLVCLEGCLRVFRRGLPPLHETCLDAGLIFLLVGGLWAAAHRAGMKPMGFDDTVVLLTANHFHYAGFVLPIAAGLCGRAMPGRFASLTALAVIAGVPLVAVGITSTQYGGPKLLESVAALLMAASGVGVAWMHLRLAGRPGAGRVLLGIAGISLVAGMLLAALYATRFYTHTDTWLTIPWMRALHGSINVFGFALPALLGWLAHSGSGSLSAFASRNAAAQR